MRQKLIEVTKPQVGDAAGPAHLTSPATLETFSRFLSCQVEKNTIVPIQSEALPLSSSFVECVKPPSIIRWVLISVIYRSLIGSGAINIPLYHQVTNEEGEAETPAEGGGEASYAPINDDFYALTFWFDLLGHRLVEALPAEYRVSFRDELLLRVALESHELVYALDWTVVKFSRRVLTPDCVLYSLQWPTSEEQFLQQQQQRLQQQQLLQQQHQQQSQAALFAHSREVTSRVILFSTLQAVCAYGRALY